MTTLQPTGHIAVVTGASRTRGIGAAICRALALHGTAVFFTHWTPFDEEAGFPVGDGPEALLSELQRAAPAQAMPLDLSQPEAVPQLLDAVEAWLGTPDILVNNAVYWQEAGYQDLTPEVLDRHIAINVRAPIMLSADFARRLGDRGWGRIVSLVSGQDHSGEVRNLPYGSTKGAVSAMTRYLALELAPKGITVNAVDPGPTDTGWMSDEQKAQIVRQTAAGRLGLPDDAARAVVWLAGEEADWITGQVIRSDGGFTG